MPEPFGPVTSRNPPACEVEVDPVEDAPVAVALREAAGADHDRYTCAAARWKPSGCPAAANVVGDLLHLPDPAPAFRRGGAFRARQARRELGRRAAATPPRRRSAGRRRGWRAASRRCPSTTPRTPSSAADAFATTRGSRSEPANNAATDAAPGAREIQRRPGLAREARRRCRRRRSADAAPRPRARAAARSRSRRRRRRRDPEPTRDVERGVRRADREDQLGLAGERRSPSRCRETRPRGHGSPRFGPPRPTAPRGRSPAAPARPPSPSRPDGAARRRSQHVDEHEGEERERDHAVHREERRVEPAQVARPDERVLVDEQAARRTPRRASSGSRREPEPGGDEEARSSPGGGRARPRTRRARRSASPRSAAPARGRPRRRTASRRGRSPRPRSRRAAPSAHACHGRSPLIAAQAPTGARPSTAPSQKWQSHVKRFRYG